MQKSDGNQFLMPYKEKEIQKLFYSIGEVAKIFDVKTSLIRFWEKEFDIIQPQKNKKGNRLFTKSDIDNFHVIFHLVKERGYTLEGAKKALKKKKGAIVDQSDAVQTLKKIRTFLEEMRDSL